MHQRSWFIAICTAIAACIIGLRYLGSLVLPYMSEKMSQEIGNLIASLGFIIAYTALTYMQQSEIQFRNSGEHLLLLVIPVIMNIGWHLYHVDTTFASIDGILRIISGCAIRFAITVPVYGATMYYMPRKIRVVHLAGVWTLEALILFGYQVWLIA